MDAICWGKLLNNLRQVDPADEWDGFSTGPTMVQCGHPDVCGWWHRAKLSYVSMALMRNTIIRTSGSGFCPQKNGKRVGACGGYIRKMYLSGICAQVGG